MVEKIVFRVSGNGKTAVVRRSFAKSASKAELLTCLEEVLAQFGPQSVKPKRKGK